MALDDAARGFLIDKGFDPAFGARPLRRAIESHLESPLSEALLGGALGDSPSTVFVTLDGDKLAFSAKKPRGAMRASSHRASTK